jgi:hypothetical protein
LVVATPAYQTAYQSVRPGPIKQVLRRTLAPLSAAVKCGRILADTEEVSTAISTAKASDDGTSLPTSADNKAVIPAHLGTTLSRGDVFAHPQ